MSNYLNMCRALNRNIDFNEPSPVLPPHGIPFETARMRAVVRENAAGLPRLYRDEYATLLDERMEDLVADLKRTRNDLIALGPLGQGADTKVTSFAETLLGAVRDWNAPEYASALKRFEAVISNLYRSFLSKRQRTNVPLPLIETIPPLATFAASAVQGPFTLPSDAVKQLVTASIGIVSLPACYRGHPLIWPAVAHETGGHDVLHADPGLLQELETTVQREVPGGLGRLWASWIDEAASDVYGLLNLGPAFAVSLAAFSAALRASSQQGSPMPLGAIGTNLMLYNGQPLDAHPVDILRVYLASGAVGALTQLRPTVQRDWIDLLDDIGGKAAGGARDIEIIELTKTKKVVQRLPIPAMADTARVVGKLIATTQLASLGGHSIQDIETWSDEDEFAATTVREKVRAGSSLVGAGDDAQLLAGTTMAFYEAPSAYGKITKTLETALDDSYARDPFFGLSCARIMLPRWPWEITGVAYSRTPASPMFPLANTAWSDQAVKRTTPRSGRAGKSSRKPKPSKRRR
jgi:hypothetical protein